MSNVARTSGGAARPLTVDPGGGGGEGPGRADEPRPGRAGVRPAVANGKGGHLDQTGREHCRQVVESTFGGYLPR
ncbi:hypothetical protein AB0M05_11640 [Streptomyces violaceusniger]|uniref:hypothetical protein n=1 Tax=Streptomyces violaceusniger TaxID=68280 RepID=UPI00342487EA